MYRPAFLLLVLLGLLAAGCPQPSAAPPAGASSVRPCGVPELNQPVPDFAFTTLSGDTQQLADLRGQVIVADFWAMLCLGCVEGLQAYQADPELSSNPRVTLLAFSTDRSQAAIQGFVKEKGWTFPVALATDPVREALAATGRLVLPEVRILDTAGRLRYRLGAEQATHQTVKCLVDHLLGEEQTP